MIRKAYLCLTFSCGFAVCLAAQENTSSTATTSDYRLTPGDKLLFQIKEDPIQNAEPMERIVSSLGELTLPVSAGYPAPTITLNVRGKSLKQVSDDLESRLEDAYYHQATLSIRLKESTPRLGEATFFGEGGVRGVVPIQPGKPKWLSEAIVQLGYSEFAKLSKVKVNRVDPKSGRFREIIVDVEAVLFDGEREKDLILQDGDRVEVPEKKLLF